MSITFDQFKDIVAQHWSNAEKIGSFQSFQKGIRQGRMLHEWQSRTFGAVVYDSDDEPTPWTVDNGRGTFGRGASYEEADENEKTAYDKGYEAQMSAQLENSLW